MNSNTKHGNDNVLVGDSDEIETIDTEPDESEQEISIEIEFDSEGGDDLNMKIILPVTYFVFLIQRDKRRLYMQVDPKCSRRRATTWQARYFEDFVTWE